MNIQNPLIRGFRNFEIQRVLVISYDDDSSTIYCRLHPSQAHLSDEVIEYSYCIFSDEFALVIEPDELTSDLEKNYPQDGTVRLVLYRIVSDDDGTQTLVGYTPSEDLAQQVIKLLAFSTGHYSRCWEISSKHLQQRAKACLESLLSLEEPTGLLFEVFRVPGSDAIGCKLLSTPWTNEHLVAVDGSNAEQLREEQLRAELPESLVDVLHLAGQADARFLLFDPDAPTLNDLPIYDE